MSTYSINPGQPTEANKLVDLQAMLSELPDNTTKLIEPHDLRDAVFTAWENIIFKPTTNTANIEYIGIDQNDFREKIFLGKKQLSGSDILTTNLLNTDVDVFLYNTKLDNDLNNQNFKLGFLAGPSSSTFYYGLTLSIPYIETKYITNTYGNVLDLNIKNDSYTQLGLTKSGGNISIESKYGNVLINSLIFPTIASNSVSSVADGSILKYKNVGGYPYLVWDSNTPTITTINSGTTYSISANPLLINGKDINFTDSNPIPNSVGSFAAGSTFSNVHITDMIRGILYPYVAPIVTLSTTWSSIERSIFNQVLSFSYSITKVIASSSITSITTTPLFWSSTSAAITYLNASPTINRNVSDYVTYSYIPSVSGIQTFTLSVRDNLGATVSASIGINIVYPIFYGVSSTASATASTVQSLLASFNKIISNNPNQTISYSGNGVCLYYCVPAIYNTGASVSSFIDETNAPGFNQYTAFRINGNAFTMSLFSPGSLWPSIVYNCYIYSPSGIPTTTTLGIPPYYNANFSFTF
jgi:hypothetical protein